MYIAAYISILINRKSEHIRGSYIVGRLRVLTSQCINEPTFKHLNVMGIFIRTFQRHFNNIEHFKTIYDTNSQQFRRIYDSSNILEIVIMYLSGSSFS